MPKLPKLTSGYPARVLVAEDDRELRSLIVSALERDGLVVESVESGTAALTRLLDVGTRPDAVVSDVRMPGRNGVDVVRELRRAGVDVPVIFITGFGASLDEAEVASFRNVAMLEKPFDLDDLRTALRNLTAICHATNPFIGGTKQ